MAYWLVSLFSSLEKVASSIAPSSGKSINIGVYPSKQDKGIEMSFRIPLTPKEFDVTILEKLIQTKYPNVRLESLSLVDAALSSDGEERVSTAGRITFDVLYKIDNGVNLPKRLMIKVARPEFVEIPLYENEVNIYTRLGDEILMNMPRSLGGFRDHESLSFGLVLEDLRTTDVTFENVLSKFRIKDTAALLEQLALLHAPYWESPRFNDDLDWVQPHTSGEPALHTASR